MVFVFFSWLRGFAGLLRASIRKKVPKVELPETPDDEGRDRCIGSQLLGGWQRSSVLLILVLWRALRFEEQAQGPMGGAG